MGMSKSNVRLFILSAFYILFLVIGASIFSAIEAPQEINIIRNLRNLRSQFLQENTCVKDEELEYLIVTVINANNRGVSAVNNVTMEPNWSFGQSLFFSSTVITTIGYGHVTPLSEGGRVFCIVYALIGIPITLILLTAYVERLMIPTTLCLQFLNSRLGHLYQAFHIRILHLSVVGVLVLVLFFFIPAGIFAYLEPDWDYLDSLYYCFISLTTIGLGDLIPGDSSHQDYRPLYKVCTTGFLLIGLTFMMLFLATLYDIPQLNFSLFFLLKSDASTDPEKMRLHPSTGMFGPKYTQQIDEPTIRHVKAVPHPASSSPEENP
ncbi:potassium channel subfamily K member 1-like [Centruroides sculpturatus]|uniref:potassium channel subfamily K member 1-like n=1 Tax=Centruroides sculpturatus TaxID=218467 RepID=UPI000C6CA2A0|nr:potassium channel subfamily K member 1-like [Centruroides sculpturatus]